MSLHPDVLADLLTAEADVACDRLGDRIRGIETTGDIINVTFDAQARSWRLRLTGTEYDRLPVSVAFVDGSGIPLPGEQWPEGLAYPGLHPVLKTVWTCQRGTLEYHLFPGHTAADDSWDANRADHRVADVIDHILQRCGV